MPGDCWVLLLLGGAGTRRGVVPFGSLAAIPSSAQSAQLSLAQGGPAAGAGTKGSGWHSDGQLLPPLAAGRAPLQAQRAAALALVPLQGGEGGREAHVCVEQGEDGLQLELDWGACAVDIMSLHHLLASRRQASLHHGSADQATFNIVPRTSVHRSPQQ